MAFVRLRRPFVVSVSIGAVTILCFFLILHDYRGGNGLALSKVVSWLGLVKPTEEPTSVFFAETAGKLYLEAREACSIESAAYHHPTGNVTLYTIGAFAPTDPYVNLLRNISNVHIKHLNLSELFENTPLSIWHSNGLIQESYYPVEHLSDAVRLALLFKYGGVYLDTDVIVIRSFRGVRNAAGLQAKEEVNGAILVFDKNSEFLRKCMGDYVQHFSAGEWDTQGPALVTRNIKDACNTDVLKYYVNDPYECEGVTLLSEEAFYPIPWPSWNKLFEPADTVDLDLSRSYSVHLWGKLSRSKLTAPGNNTVLENLAMNNCPAVYQLMQRTGTI